MARCTAADRLGLGSGDEGEWRDEPKRDWLQVYTRVAGLRLLPREEWPEPPDYSYAGFLRARQADKDAGAS